MRVIMMEHKQSNGDKNMLGQMETRHTNRDTPRQCLSQYNLEVKMKSNHTLWQGAVFYFSGCLFACYSVLLTTCMLFSK